MNKIKIYTPVIGPVKGDGSWSTLPMAQNEDPEQARYNAAKCCAGVRDGFYEVKRLDEHYIYADTKQPV